MFNTGTNQSSVGSSLAQIGVAYDKNVGTYVLKIQPGSRFWIDNHYGLTGQSGFKDSNGNNIYLAFWKGLLVGAGRSAFSTSTYPWLAY
jgi:hypothetical protein